MNIFSCSSGFELSVYWFSPFYYYYLTCHQFVEETKEIWDFWNIILWAFEYCLLPYNLSLGVVSEVTFYKNHLVHVSFNAHKTPECDKLERFVLFDHGSLSLTSFSTPSMLIGKLWVWNLWPKINYTCS